MGTSISHQLRMQYMRLNEEEDERRREKYKTLDDYSDSVERELEELRQKRGESRGLMLPDWRDEHHTYWKEVERRTRDAEDLDDPAKVWEAGAVGGDVWKVAAFNRRHADTSFEQTSKMILSATGVSSGGGGGKMVAAAQQAPDQGPKQFVEAPSSEEEEEETKKAKAEETMRRRKGGRGKGKVKQRGRGRRETWAKAMPEREKEYA